MKTETLYLLTSKWDGCETNDLLDKEVNSPWFCKNCSRSFDGIKQIDALIDDDTNLSKQKPLTLVVGFVNRMYLWHQELLWEEFLKPIPPHILKRDMYLGDVFRQDKTLIEGWRTYRCRYNLFLRGTKNISQVTVCKDCGLVRYWAAGKLFVYPNPPEDADIFECSGLLMRESVYHLLDMEKWKKKIYVQKVVVAPVPLDGLELPQFRIPRDFEWIKKHQELERL
ncbi:MAG: hypothetical protein LBH00_07455 [Planctomycetaceae bacterium]|jgi:hypothetical protein|nr:hypothetical protein [Planctomycetaceae bacterium]